MGKPPSKWENGIPRLPNVNKVDRGGGAILTWSASVWQAAFIDDGYLNRKRLASDGGNFRRMGKRYTCRKVYKQIDGHYLFDVKGYGSQVVKVQRI